MNPANIQFRKKGSEIKKAVRTRCSSLRARLVSRNKALDSLMADRKKLRSYLVLGISPDSHSPHQLYGSDAISREEIFEINQICRRVQELEAQLYDLELLLAHLNDDDEFTLSLGELVSYGFDLKT